MNTLTQKETTLLQDEKKHEETCIEKYDKYASQASNPQLKALFQELGSKEKEHLNTINQILGGTVPSMKAGQSSQQKPQLQAMTQPQATTQSQSTLQSQVLSQSQLTSEAKSQAASNSDSQRDGYLCTDALSTEKFISSTYNTAIFEFKDANIRQALNHIQKEEQEHGEKIYNYMSQNGMYS